PELTWSAVSGLRAPAILARADAVGRLEQAAEMRHVAEAVVEGDARDRLVAAVGLEQRTPAAIEAGLLDERARRLPDGLEPRIQRAARDTQLDGDGIRGEVGVCDAVGNVTACA